MTILFLCGFFLIWCAFIVCIFVWFVVRKKDCPIHHPTCDLSSDMLTYQSAYSVQECLYWIQTKHVNDTIEYDIELASENMIFLCMKRCTAYPMEPYQKHYRFTFYGANPTIIDVEFIRDDLRLSNAPFTDYWLDCFLAQKLNAKRTALSPRLQEKQCRPWSNTRSGRALCQENDGKQR